MRGPSVIRRLARPYAMVGLFAALVGAVGAIALRIIDPVPVIVTLFGFSDGALVGFEVLGLAFAGVGGLLVARRPENAVGWCMVLIGDGYALAGLAAAATFSAVADGPAGVVAAGFAGWLTVLCTTIGGLVFGLGFIFPTGRGQTPGLDRLLRLGALGSPVVLSVLFLVRPGPLHLFPDFDNPFGIGPDIRTLMGPDPSSVIAGSAILFVPVLAWSIVARYRASDSVGRQQLKWFIVAILVTIGGVAVAGFGALVNGQAPEVGLVVFGYAGALVPVAIGIAILRYRLYDIDRIISRTLAYAVVTGILALMFGAMILVLPAVLARFTEGQAIAVAASTLVVFTLFQPVLRRVRRSVDQRFDRARYDAEITAAAFSDRLRDEVDLATVTTDFVRTAGSALSPATLGVWLRGGSR